MNKRMAMLSLIMIAASANGQIRYDYVELGYENVSIEDLALSGDNLRVVFDETDGDGLVFEGSFSFGENYFVYADFDFSSLDLASFDLGNDRFVDPVIDLNTQALGVGYHTDGNSQLVTKVAFLRQEFDSAFFKVATLGYIVELGGRGLLGDNFEWEANLDYTDPDANDGPSGKLGVNTSLRYNFGKNFSTDFSAATADDVVTYGLNLRFNFSRK